MDNEFDRTRLARMHTTMQRYVDSGRMPGLVTLVSHRGRVHVDTIGTMAFDRRAPMRRDTIFRLASMTKPITAIGAMILVEECRLRLDDAVDEWLPELKERKVLRRLDGPVDDTVAARRGITVRDLLTFRAGYGEVGFVAPGSPIMMALMQSGVSLASWPFKGSPDQFLQQLGALPLAHQPGERWLYHQCADLIGVLIARVAGKPLSAFLRERIFEPLGMKDTAFHVPEEKVDRLATCYITNFPSTEMVAFDPTDGQPSRPPAFESGAGGLVSTVDDMLALGAMMMNKGRAGKERVLARASVELMTTDQLTPEQKAASAFFENFWDSFGWGLGLGIIARRTDFAAPGRFGWDGAFGTSWHVDPKEKLIGVLMTQRRPDWLALGKMPDVFGDFWTSAYQLVDD